MYIYIYITYYIYYIHIYIYTYIYIYIFTIHYVYIYIYIYISHGKTPVIFPQPVAREITTPCAMLPFPSQGSDVWIQGVGQAAWLENQTWLENRMDCYEDWKTLGKWWFNGDFMVILW